MIIDLPNTGTRAISRKIDELHEERGEAATGRVLTLLISTNDQELERSLEVANVASREHPCRVIAIVPQKHPPISADPASNLDAQVRFGADAGAGEVIVLHPRGGLIDHPDTLVIPLLVPDAPVAAWWPTEPPENPSKDLLGTMARSHITDAKRSEHPAATFSKLREHWTPEDVDLSWTQLTVWRAMLASMLDQPPHNPVISAKVSGPKDFLPLDLLAAWLRVKLDVPVSIEFTEDAPAVSSVTLSREDGSLSLDRPGSDLATISLPSQTPQPIVMPIRTLEDCLSEELRRIYPDDVYAEVINTGWDLMFG